MTTRLPLATEDLHIHLDMAGLPALMRAIETAMEGGRGRLELGPGGCGVAAQAGASGAFETAIVSPSRKSPARHGSIRRCP